MTRSQIEKQLETLRTATEVLATNWRELLDSMQSYYDDRSEKWQEGEKGEEYSEMIDAIAEQVDQLEEIANFGF